MVIGVVAAKRWIYCTFTMLLLLVSSELCYQQYGVLLGLLIKDYAIERRKKKKLKEGNAIDGAKCHTPS